MLDGENNGNIFISVVFSGIYFTRSTDVYRSYTDIFPLSKLV